MSHDLPAISTGVSLLSLSCTCLDGTQARSMLAVSSALWAASQTEASVSSPAPQVGERGLVTLTTWERMSTG